MGSNRRVKKCRVSGYFAALRPFTHRRPPPSAAPCCPGNREGDGQQPPCQEMPSLVGLSLRMGAVLLRHPEPYGACVRWVGQGCTVAGIIQFHQAEGAGWGGGRQPDTCALNEC
jgi:hypothetical protein